MRDDDDGLLTVEEAIEELDDWYDDYGRTIDDYDIYDSDRLDEEDLTQLEWALDVRIDDNLVVACDVTYAGGATRTSTLSLCRSAVSGICCLPWTDPPNNTVPGSFGCGRCETVKKYYF